MALTGGMPPSYSSKPDLLCQICGGRRTVSLRVQPRFSAIGSLNSLEMPELTSGYKDYPCPECRFGGDPIFIEHRVDSAVWREDRGFKDHTLRYIAHHLGEVLLKSGKIKIEEHPAPEFRAVHLRVSIGSGSAPQPAEDISGLLGRVLASIVGQIESWGLGATYRDDKLIDKNRVIGIISGVMAKATGKVPQADMHAARQLIEADMRKQREAALDQKTATEMNARAKASIDPHAAERYIKINGWAGKHSKWTE